MEQKTEKLVQAPSSRNKLLRGMATKWLPVDLELKEAPASVCLSVQRLRRRVVMKGERAPWQPCAGIKVLKKLPLLEVGEVPESLNLRRRGPFTPKIKHALNFPEPSARNPISPSAQSPIALKSPFQASRPQTRISKPEAPKLQALRAKRLGPKI